MIEISVILLNYNSFDDLINSYSDLNNQKNIKLTYIIVDNNSNEKCIKNIRNWENNILKNRVRSGDFNELLRYKPSSNIDTYIIYNNENNGYSAGNNLGVKLSESLGIETIIIANPDMRFNDEFYCKQLFQTLKSNTAISIASSRIIGLDNKDQSPIREIGPFEEIIWFRDLVPYYKKNNSYIEKFKPNSISYVNKIMGCCFMIKLDFLKEIDYFDENTFLYSEEAILSAQTRKKKKLIAFNSNLSAIHAHDITKKDNNSKRMLLMIKSRKYYLDKYSGYNRILLSLIKFSYLQIGLLHKLKYKIKG